jgi:hypothetical protein
MKRLFMIADKLPLQVIENNGEKELIPNTDGFDSGLSNFYNSFDIKWVGRAGVNINEISEIEKQEIDNKLNILKGFAVIPSGRFLTILRKYHATTQRIGRHIKK